MAEKLLKLEQIRVRSGFNPRFDYGDIEEYTRYLDANGTRLVKPLDVVPAADEHGVIIPDMFDIIDGHRTWAGILGMGTKPAAVRCNVIDKLKDGEDILLTWLRNQGKHLSPWEQAAVVQKLIERSYSQTQIAKRLNISDVRVSRLSILTDMPEWVWDAGLRGQLSATLVWQLWDDAKEDVNQSKLPSVVKQLEKQRKKIFEVGVTAKDFDFSSPIAKLQAELAETKAKAEAEKKAKEQKEAELKAAKEAAVQAKQKQAVAEQANAELQKQQAGQQAVANSTTVQPTGESPALSSDNAQPGNATSAPVGDDKPADITVQPTSTAPASTAPAPTAPASTAPASTAPEQAPVEQTPSEESKTSDSSSRQGQGETEASRKRARIQALVGLINSASDTTSLTKDCKSRLGDAVKRLNDIQKWSLELVGLTE